MAAILMSNPLHMAVLGNPRRKKRKTTKRRNPAKRKPAYWAKSRKVYSQSKRRAKARAGGATYMAGNETLIKVSRVTVRRKAGKKVSPRNKRTGKTAVAWAGRRGTVSYSGTSNKGNSYTWTNPKRRKTMAKRKRAVSRRRRNPALSLKGFAGGITGAPANIMALFKGKKKATNIGFTAGGTVGTYLLGGMLAKYSSPLLAKIPVLGDKLGDPMVQRVTGALFPYTAGFLASVLVGKKNKNLATAIHLGGAVAGILELAMPGKLGQWTSQIPGIDSLTQAAGAPDAEAGPVEGLAGYFGGYVDAPSYAGVGGYVDAPSYAGVGGYVDAPSYAGVGDDAAVLAGYVDAPSYAGVGDDAAVLAGDADMLAGSFVDENYMESFLG